MNAKHYEVRVNNYNAQLKRHDWIDEYATKHEAAEAIYARFFDRICDDADTKASEKFDFDTDETKWREEEARQLEAAVRDIEQYGYEDGDGHRYYIEEVDDDVGE